MSFDNTPIIPESSGTPGPVGWVQTWIKAVTQPNEQTFVDISESAEASPKTAYLWVFLVTTLSYFVIALAQGAVTAMSGSSDSIGMFLGIAVCGSPIIGGLAVLGFMLSTAIVQWIAKLFGGTGSYEKLIYPLAAISAPISLVSSVFTVFSAIPMVGLCTGFISIGIAFYSVYLNVIAVKAVNRFGWGQAAGSVLIPGFVILFVCGCVVVGSLTILGPVIGEVFNGINQSLQMTP